MNPKNKQRNVNKKNEQGFTLVEVIAVLVILGILAAVAIPKFFDMQDTAREKSIEGAIGELNGQVALAYAQNALSGGVAGAYDGYTGDLGTSFTLTGQAPDAPGVGTILLAAQPTHVWNLLWVAGDTESPGYFTRGAKI
ncbi:MAG: type II secretion system protein [Deltaproteobacteria bacterium]|nr:type II secretion system protein [Deltaproteobacteria bacterium]